MLVEFSVIAVLAVLVAMLAMLKELCMQIELK